MVEHKPPGDYGECMADNKPEPGDRKPSYVSPLIIGILVIALGVVVFFREPAPQPPEATSKADIVAPPAPAPVPKPVVAPPPLQRQDLIFEARRAASDFGATGKLPSTAALVGRRFAFSIPFGCGGVQASAPGAQLSVSYDATNQSITLTARPGTWTTLPQIQGLADPAAIDAVEGFWIPRAWTDSESCPPQLDYSAPVTPTPPTAQTIGLAQLFAAGGSRLARHAERPYQFTRKLPAGDTSMLAMSYRMVLEGRITGFDKDTALRCAMEAPDHQPVCLFAVTFERVTFRDEKDKQIATWTD